MQRIYIYLFTFCLISVASAQQKNREPLILQGKLDNCPEKFLKIHFFDENNKVILDTLHLNDKGEFYLKTYKIIRPQRSNLSQNNTQINQIYVAPGFNLHFTGDATDSKTLMATKKITGIGSETNGYRILIDSVYRARKDRRAWYDLNNDELISYISEMRSHVDSIHHHVFEQSKPKDPYFSVFRKMTEIDQQSMALYMVLEFAVMNNWSPAKMKEFVEKNTPPLFARGISNDNYLISDDYTSWTLPLYYEYWNKLDKLKDSVAVQKPNYSLLLVNKVFTGKVKQYYLQYAVNKALSRTTSIKELYNEKKKSQLLYDAISSTVIKNDIAKSYSERENQLLRLEIGKPAPPFELFDESGNVHRLDDFKGKVIYIDLWASWCIPCRAEMPNFQALTNKFKGNKDVAFMGIAVFDGEKEWRKALSEEKPDWLQLYDTGGLLAKSYVASAIPKYILIDRNGKIVSFNAPGPGDQTIEEMIKDEIEKRQL